MTAWQPAYVTVSCETCGAEPKERCMTAEGKPFNFGSTHVARVRAGLRAHNSATPREEAE